MVEIGDTCHVITAYLGYDSENDDSGQHISKSKIRTKKGNFSLRQTLFMFMVTLIQNRPEDNPV